MFKFAGTFLTHQTLFSLQVEDGLYIEDPVVMGKVLHNCEPNMICNMNDFTFIASRDIIAGEWLTMDYETTEDILWRNFECCCGTRSCRGLIKGRKVPLVVDSTPPMDPFFDLHNILIKGFSPGTSADPQVGCAARQVECASGVISHF